MSLREERKQQSREALLEAALALSSRGHAFSSISLREITHEVGLVPAAFYRHFQNMDQLGLELLDQVAIHFKHALTQLWPADFSPDQIPTRLRLFFQAVDTHPEAWIFLSAERWGGSQLLRHAIEREIHYLIEDLLPALQQHPLIRQHPRLKLKALAQLLVPLALDWAMGWINLQKQPDAELHAEDFQRQTVIQMQLLSLGLLSDPASA